MSTPVLLDLCRHLANVRSRDWERLAIDDLCLDSLFTSVRLSDGSVGLAMNYDLEGSHSITYAQVDETRRRLRDRLTEEPLLWQFLQKPSPSLGQQALLVAVLSALSAPVLADDVRLRELGLVSSQGRVALKSFEPLGCRKVAVVGFGGFLEEALAQDWLVKVSCIDFLANDEEFRRINPYPFRLYQEASKRMDVVYDDGPRAVELIEEADVVCISASTLCNGSLESLLPSPRADRVVILEGPSGGVLPGPLFERGVTHLVHNPVDVDFVELSHRFSRQTRQGLQKINSGRFIDVILPEQRTVSTAERDSS
jgi:hypothetical protein